VDDIRWSQRQGTAHLRRTQWRPPFFAAGTCVFLPDQDWTFDIAESSLTRLGAPMKGILPSQRLVPAFVILQPRAVEPEQRRDAFASVSWLYLAAVPTFQSRADAQRCVLDVLEARQTRILCCHFALSRLLRCLVGGFFRGCDSPGAALGNRTRDLRITSRKRVVHQVLAPRGRGRGCVQASMIAQSVGCSLGCSHSQLGKPVNPQSGGVFGAEMAV
jgi:hypothetical protein